MEGTNAREHLGRAIAAAAEAVNLGDLVTDALPPLLGAVGASNALVYRYGEGSVMEALGGSLAGVMGAYTRDVFARDPLQGPPRALPPGIKVVMVSRVVDRRAFVTSDAYHAFYAPHDVSHVTCLWLTGTTRYGEPGMTGILLGRAPGEDPFSEREAAVLGEALPALAAAVRRSARLEEADGRRRALEAIAAGAISRPVIAVSRAGRVLWMSRAAEMLLGAACELPPGLLDAARRLAAAADGARPERVPSVAASYTLANGTQVRVELTVTRATSGEPVVLAELAGNGDGGAAFAARARAEGLTRAEAEVLAILAGGVSNAEIAARLHVSVETVRTHVARILRKLDVATRAQAAVQAKAWMG
jgi:DNA-binding CsgD family transcriptional regulator